MSGNVAVNRETGEVLVISPEGQWQPAQRARNPQTGQEVYFDGNGWQDVPRRQRTQGEEATRRFGMGVRDVGQGLGMVPGLVYDAAAVPINLATRGINALTGAEIPQIRSASRNIDALADAAGLARPETREERVISGINRNTAAVLPTLGAGVAARGATEIPRAFNAGRAAVADLALQAPTQLAAGAVSGAVEGATDSPLAGVAAGLAVPVIGAGLSRVITPIRTPQSPERAALVAAAEREGIPLTAGQATGNQFLQLAESQLEQLPFTSGAARASRQAQQEAFTRASLRHAGIDSPVASPEVLAAARSRIGSVFDDLSSRNRLVIDDDARAALTQLAQRFQDERLPDYARLGQHRINQVLARAADGGGEVPGTFYREMDHALGQQIRGTQDGDLRTTLGEVRDMLRGLMDLNISPADQEAWQRARRQYANLMVSARAANGAGASVAEGQISPLMLRNALNQSTGQGYVWGRGDQNELARIGQSLVRQPPDSKTAGRTLITQILTGSILSGAGGVAAGPLGLIGALATPRLAQVLMNSPAGQAYLRNRAIQGPDINARLLAEILAQRGDHTPPTLPGPRRN